MTAERPEKKDIAQIFREGTAIDEALDRSFRKTVRYHKRNGFPMVFWENGKIVTVPPEELPDFPTE